MHGGRKLAALAVVLAACLGSGPTGPEPAGPDDGELPPNALRVLFIGNSLTYANDLPGVVAAMARATNQERPPGFSVLALPDFSLEDHWRTGAAERALRERRWDIVVLQQGPSSLPESQEHLRTWAKTFAAPIRAAGAEPALYMVWPSRTRSGDFPGVLASYSGAADAVDGIFLPAGQAWQEAWQTDPDLALYGPDGFHPSVLGTWLAALVIFSRLYDVDPTTVPAELTVNGSSLRISEETAAVLRAAAVRALEAWP